MKTGLLHLNVKRDKINDFRKVWDQLSLELRKERGFLSVFLFINAETGKCLSLGFYDTAENAKALQSSATYKKFMASIQDFVIGTPHREVCDVAGDLDKIAASRKVA